MIEALSLTKQFGDFTAVRSLSLHVKAGEILALLGPNGAGKTTTTRMLAGILTPTAGTARVGGFDVIRQSEEVRSLVGVLTEHHGLYGRMHGGEYLDFFGALYGLSPAERNRRAEALLEEVGLRIEPGQWLSEFSKGMRQRLSLVRTLLHAPKVLLLDEPTSALDPESARLVRNLLRRRRAEGCAILACTHNLAEAEELADRIAIIRRGRLIEQGAPADLRQRLLGDPVFEVRTAKRSAALAAEVASFGEIVGRGPGWVRFRSARPKTTHPKLLQHLARKGVGVVELCEVTPSIEAVYLQAVEAEEAE